MVCCKCNNEIPSGGGRVCQSCGHSFCEDCASANYDMCDCYCELGYPQ